MGLEDEMEYTQEQIDAMKAEAIKSATEGLMSKADADKIADQRVESGIKKGLETFKSKWEQDAQEKANLTAQEIADKRLAEKIKELETREHDANVRDNSLTAKSKLNQAGVPESYYSKLLGNLVNADSDVTGSNVDNLIDIYTSTKSQIEADIKAKLSKVPPAEGGNDAHAGEMTKEKFSKLDYKGMMKLKTEKPDVYKQMMK